MEMATKAQNVGNFHCPLVFFFRQLKGWDPVYFHIVRFIHALCKNELMHDLKPTTPYRTPLRVVKPRGVVTEIIPGLKMPT